ncbi:metallophosphoesterase [Exilibacterium tricleocarpae]|uniref:Metallophosphoesterase n=1 Tax=Exilibacterium tricleocarpae TaxID=2591008 RepID=A0A545SL84_9GAMM|nr:metallophosphoesterase [Exilibacterium tricleocarpae]TQV65744.1 metallophosphoesterase [Exilibacterium tricleocarpae]
MSIIGKSPSIWLALICAALATARLSAAPAGINDGPYISFTNNKLEAVWLCDGQVKREHDVVSALPKTFSQCGLSAEINSLNPAPQELEYNGDFPIAAISDIHGQFDLMIKLLVNNGIVDTGGNWAFGRGHFMVAGDIFNRGDKVTEALWFLYRLEQQARVAGGHVHILLGNHEVMVLNNDLRYAHKKYHQVAELLERPFASLFRADTVLGTWLRSKPAAIKLNKKLFVHGGISPSLLEMADPLISINTVFTDHLVEDELEKSREGIANYIYGRNGPVWYRGYFRTDGASTDDVEEQLEHFQVSHIIVGHTSQKTIETRHRGMIVAIDASMKKGQYGELLFIDGDRMWRGSLMGERLPLVK